MNDNACDLKQNVENKQIMQTKFAATYLMSLDLGNDL